MTEQLPGQLMFAEVAAMQAEAEDEKYQAFVEKFKPKKTTDDCYTPPGVMDAVNAWVAAEYGYDPARFVRPFYPDGDYEAEEYPPGCAVVDNPPFSILVQIYDFYLARGVPFFLFAPTLTCMNCLNKHADTMTVILCGVRVIYENGADVNTSFVTNMDAGRIVRTCPDLREAAQAAADAYGATLTKSLPKYRYPDAVLSGKDHYLSKYGQAFDVRRGEAAFIRELDAQRSVGKGVFGGGLLLSERAAAERAAAERAAAERAAAERAAAERAAAVEWALSEREIEIIKGLGAR